MPSYREDPQMADQIQDFLDAGFANKTVVLRTAVALLHAKWFGEEVVIGWAPIVVSVATQCDATGAEIPAGSVAYREVVRSDMTAARTLCRAAFLAAGGKQDAMNEQPHE